MGEVFPPVQQSREDAPEQPKARRESGSWAFLCRNFVFTGSELTLCSQQSGGQNGLGAEDGPHKHQGIANHFTNPAQHTTYVHQQASYDIHAGRITESTVCSKFA